MTERLLRSAWTPCLALLIIATASPTFADEPDEEIVVEAACGQCLLGLPGTGCDLAVKIDDEAYYVTGVDAKGLGDPDGRRGICNAVRRARVRGKVEQDRFVAVSFELLPLEETVAKHGGELSQVGDFQAETTVELDGARVYFYGQDGEPIDVSEARGTVVVKMDGDPKRYRYDLYPDVAKDQSASSLYAAADFTRFDGKPLDTSWQVMGLPDQTQRPLKFAVKTTAPLTDAQLVAQAIEKQRVCPVSGHALGGMGKPVPVTVGEDTIYVCCKGCVATVKAEPAKYLAMVSGSKGTVPVGNEEVRPGVFKVSPEDQPYIIAQKTCPVMDEPLDAMGGPYKVHVEGKAIYICCPGCAKKVAAERAKYLSVLAEQGVTAPTLEAGAVAPAHGEEVRAGVFKVTAADQPFVEAQKVCPVMDEPLDGMGGPYRVDVEGKAVYICCPGCAKRLQTDPETYFKRLAASDVAPPAAPQR